MLQFCMLCLLCEHGVHHGGKQVIMFLHTAIFYFDFLTMSQEETYNTYKYTVTYFFRFYLQNYYLLCYSHANNIQVHFL